MADNLPEPKSRKESYLAKAAGMDTTIPENPESREEQYLAAIAEGGGGGGGTSDFDQLANRPKYNGTAMTGETNIPEVNNLTAGSGIDITSGVISATNTGLAKVLTSADYNYDSDNDGVNDYVGLWRLEPGIYDLSGLSASEWRADLRNQFSLKGYPYSTAIITRQGTQSTNAVEIYLLFQKYSTMVALGHAGVIVHNEYRGTSYNYTLFNPIPEDNLTSTSTTRPLSANQGKVLKELVDSLAIRGAGAPDTTTVGQVGTLYEDTTNGDLYICTDATNPYVWEAVGGGGITPVQTTGTSTTDVMSQNATTSMIYASPADKKHIQIGENAKAQGSDDSISIGVGSTTIADYSMALGRGAGVASTGRCAVAIGQTASASGPYSVALGAEARAGNVRGVVAIGVLTANGYNSSNYRLLTGLYDGQSAHDAATVGQITPTTDSSVPTSSTAGRLGEIRIDTTDNSAYMCVVSDNVTPTYEWKKITA